jgi:DNA topoisomerase I
MVTVRVSHQRRDRSQPGRKRHGQFAARTPRASTPVTHVAKQAGLRYVNCSEPGIRRVKRGKGFVYRLPNGKRLTSFAELERIRKLALPPAWRDVWICTSERGHLLATGIDARGRKQYRYHPRWRAVRDEAKYNDLLAFGERLPQLRRQLARDLALPGLSRDKVLATVVSVMERTAARVGNDRYAADNGSFGLTTLLDRHAAITAGHVSFSFKGKGGKPYRAMVADRRLASIVKRCRDIPGQRLFQYVDAEGKYQAISSSDVNAYLKRVTGIDVTAKTFRTWTATLLAARELAALTPASSPTAIKRQVNTVLGVVAHELGNTPAICRKSYVDPRIIEAYVGDRLKGCAGKSTRRAGLSAEECRLLTILEASAGAQRRAA